MVGRELSAEQIFPYCFFCNQSKGRLSTALAKPCPPVIPQQKNGRDEKTLLKRNLKDSYRTVCFRNLIILHKRSRDMYLIFVSFYFLFLYRFSVLLNCCNAPQIWQKRIQFSYVLSVSIPIIFKITPCSHWLVNFLGFFQTLSWPYDIWQEIHI